MARVPVSPDHGKGGSDAQNTPYASWDVKVGAPPVQTKSQLTAARDPHKNPREPHPNDAKADEKYSWAGMREMLDALEKAARDA